MVRNRLHKHKGKKGVNERAHRRSSAKEGPMALPKSNVPMSKRGTLSGKTIQSAIKDQMKSSNPLDTRRLSKGK